MDFSIAYLGLSSDTRHHAHFLPPKETDAPAGLKVAIVENKRMQAILMWHLEMGISRNELLAGADDDAIVAGLDPTNHSQVLEFHGHGAGL